jgi:hypothetical protein
VQEYSPLNDATWAFFSGCPEIRNGYLSAKTSDWGIEADEKAAAKEPFGHGGKGERQQYNGAWGAIRRRDGTIVSSRRELAAQVLGRRRAKARTITPAPRIRRDPGSGTEVESGAKFMSTCRRLLSPATKLKLRLPRVQGGVAGGS